MGRKSSALLALVGLVTGACGSHIDREALVELNSLGLDGRTVVVPEGGSSAQAGARSDTGEVATNPGSLPADRGSPGGSVDSEVAVPGPPGSRPGAARPTEPATTAPVRTGAADAGAGRRAPSEGGSADPAAGGRVPLPGAPSEGGAAPAGSEIVLGSFGTSSGPIGANVADSPAATRAWVADVNARGGLGGHPVRVVFGDDGGEPDRALALARRMIEEDNVIGFLNLYTPTTLDAVVPYLEEQGVPVLGTECGSSAPDFSTIVFVPQISCHYGTAWSFYGTVVTQTDVRKMALLYCREAAICTNGAQQMKEFESRTEVDIVYEAQISLVQPDFTAEMISARNAGADVVTLITDSATMLRTIRSAKRQNYNPVFSGTWSFNVDSFGKAGGEDVEGVLSVSSTVAYTTSPKAKPYHDAMARHQPGAPKGNFGMTAFSTGLLLERVADHFGATVTTADLLDGIYALDGETVGGIFPPIKFHREAPVNRNLCMVPLRFSGGQFVPLDGDRFVCPEEYTR